jgi:thymidylate synthase
MKQYLELLESILEKGIDKSPARQNMPETRSLFGTRMEFDLNDGFPLLSTKKMYLKGIITELLWFISGDTNIKYLVDNKCNIWNQDAYRWYIRECRKTNQNPVVFEDFVEIIRRVSDEELIMISQQHFSNSDYVIGDIGKVYGEQWRNQNSEIDQVKTCLNRLKEDPMGRYAIIDAWNPSDFDEMALPPCHLLYQFNCRPLSDVERLTFVPLEVCENGNLEEIFKVYNPPKYCLDLQMYQRSCDTFLGVPFNIASASLFLILVAKELNMIPGKFIWIGGDTHIYENHFSQVKLQLQRTPFKLPNLKVNNFKSIFDVKIEDIELIDYVCHDPIKGDLSTGL